MTLKRRPAWWSLSAFIIALITLTDCAVIRTEPANVSLDGKHIVVVSAIGDSARHETIGFTVFGNQRSKGDISAWNLDALAEDQISAILISRNSVRVVKVPQTLYDGFSGATPDSLHSLLPYISTNSANSPPIRPDFVVLLRKIAGERASSTNQMRYGITLADRTLPLIGGEAALYLSVGIVVFDVENQKVIASRPLVSPDICSGHYNTPSEMMLGECLARVDLDSSFAVDKWSDLSAAQLQQLQAKTQQMLSASLQYTISHLIGSK